MPTILLIAGWRLYLIVIILLFQGFSLSAQDFQSYYDLGNTYLKKHNLDSALYYFDQASKIKPDTTIAYLEKCRVFMLMGKTEHAFSECTRAIEIDSMCGRAYGSRADIYIKTQQKAKAIEDYKKTISLLPDDYQTYYCYVNMGDIVKADGYLDSAKYFYSKAIDLTINHNYYSAGSAYYQRGEIYLIKGDFPNALNDFNKSIELGFNYSDCYLKRSQTFRKLGQNDEAKKDFKKYKERKSEETKKNNNTAAYR